MARHSTGAVSSLSSLSKRASLTGASVLAALLLCQQPVSSFVQPTASKHVFTLSSSSSSARRGPATSTSRSRSVVAPLAMSLDAAAGGAVPDGSQLWITVLPQACDRHTSDYHALSL
eukprot:12559-Heterococcus_DN1.PRE.1